MRWHPHQYEGKAASFRQGLHQVERKLFIQLLDIKVINEWPEWCLDNLWLMIPLVGFYGRLSWMAELEDRGDSSWATTRKGSRNRGGTPYPTSSLFDCSKVPKTDLSMVNHR
jgi:hypothetical protein